MESMSCMNLFCSSTTISATTSSSSGQWKKGWILRSGEPAVLCALCGSAFENNIFCETFHVEDSGWRNCFSCGKHLHCGCVASLYLIDILDTGGVKCKTCTWKLPHCYSSIVNKPDGCGTMGLKNAEPAYLGHYKDSVEVKQPSISGNISLNRFPVQSRREEISISPGETTIKHHSNGDKLPMRLSQRAAFDISSMSAISKDVSEFPVHRDLSFSLGVPFVKSQSFAGLAFEDREPSDPAILFQRGPSPCHLFPEPSQPSSFDANVNMAQQLRFARPPAEGRGRNHLLPRYWPRITDQELQQISGDSNCTIVPLFEKVLSASDAGRIGRLVLPKACAEAYFPPISQPEGLPLRVQDVKGNQWVFQFRFWPNNNSRMYVLEGVTLCIQSMQLQAGDTVTFSRMDPEGKLLMGFRKALNSVSVQSMKGSEESQLSTFLMQNASTTFHTSFQDTEKYGTKKEEVALTSMSFPERRKARNIGSKSKRLLIDHRDALELKLRWEEAQEMLRPPSNANPSIVVVEEYEFEEYEEPPVFGKWSVFAFRSLGAMEQWTQCDSCYRWRRIPVDVLLPAKWSCSENTWDQSRCSCSAPEELSPMELEKFMELSNDIRKKRATMSQGVEEKESCGGFDAPSNAAVLGDTASNPNVSSVALTTKHPRHRPGCSCIVCIQPPSGKGKHSPDCICFSCETVKRRFRTMMMRKKQRQSEQEPDIAQQRPDGKDKARQESGNIQPPVMLRKKQPQAEQASEMSHIHLQEHHEDEAEATRTISRHIRLHLHESEENEAAVKASYFQPNGLRYDGIDELRDSNKALDLNCQPPSQEVESQTERTHDSISNLLQPTRSPEANKMKDMSLTLEPQESPRSNLLEQIIGGVGEQALDNRCTAPSTSDANADDKYKSENDQQ